VALAAALIVPALALVLPRAAGGPGPEDGARRAAEQFLERYVQPDGRVVRHDQGGDTVSEGVSYALLLADLAGDDATFARVWRWARANLRRPDGLLAWRANRNGIIDPMPASDADLVSAWALARYTGPNARRFRRDGHRLARAVLRHETATRGSRLVLAAGPWATGEPVTINPSYWALSGFRELGRRTGDVRWARLSAGSVHLARRLSANGRALPPDWARMDGGHASPTPAPNGEAPRVQYGLDAQRVVVWLAAGCDPAGRRLARSWWRLLSQPGRDRALALTTSGAILDRRTNALPLVASAAAANAARRNGDRDRLLGEAERADAAHPTYYGSAWVALGRALLTTDLLGGCARGGSR
jgi:endoglucanase